MALYGYHIPKNHVRDPVATPFLTGPCFEFTLLIDGEEVIRQGHIAELYQDGVYWVIAADNPDLYPRHFFLNQHFPWKNYKTWIIESWARREYLPFCFTLKQKIEDELIDNLRLLGPDDFQKAIDAMRHNKILDRLRKLNSRLKPAGLTWDEIKAACFSSLPKKES